LVRRYLRYLPAHSIATYRPSEVKSGDLVGAPEIEVTPAMIEAGVSVLWESGALETFMDGVDQLLIEKIFIAMSLASRERS
jgi:hypothetical protein